MTRIKYSKHNTDICRPPDLSLSTATGGGSFEANDKDGDVVVCLARYSVLYERPTGFLGVGDMTHEIDGALIAGNVPQLSRG